MRGIRLKLKKLLGKGKKRDRAVFLAMALRWRLESRRIFERYLAAGYRVADFLPPSAATGGRCFYLLRRN